MSIFFRLFKHASVPLELNGITDWHSHILPGVDDGVQSIEESMSILDAYEKAGVKEVWLTPHVMEDMPNATEDLKARFEELCMAYQGSIDLHLASENMIDNLFDERLGTQDLLSIGSDGNMLLVETSYFNAPINLTDTLKHVKSKGYFPLLAHPERYSYMTSMAPYKELKELGVLFQLNLMSLCGYYGMVVKEKAEKLLSMGLYDFAGSDLHCMKHFEVLSSIVMNKNVASRVNELLSR